MAHDLLDVDHMIGSQSIYFLRLTLHSKPAPSAPIAGLNVTTTELFPDCGAIR